MDPMSKAVNSPKSLATVGNKRGRDHDTALSRQARNHDDTGGKGGDSQQIWEHAVVGVRGSS